jgi:uncharacterized paraquat-inducible protein A
LFRLAETLDE